MISFKYKMNKTKTQTTIHVENRSDTNALKIQYIHYIINFSNYKLLTLYVNECRGTFFYYLVDSYLWLTLHYEKSTLLHRSKTWRLLGSSRVPFW